MALFTVLLWTQGFYFLCTGLWPIVSIDTFQIVTGAKTDHWLVMTVAALVTAVGVTLLFAAWRRRDPAEVAVLAITSSVALTAIDVIYVTRAVIPPIYLADALVEVALIVAWTIALIRSRRN
jgi:CHASE2 domain-containing sensor protein